MGQSEEGRGTVPHGMLGSGLQPVFPVDEPVRLRGRKGDRRGEERLGEKPPCQALREETRDTARSIPGARAGPGLGAGHCGKWTPLRVG